MILTHRFRQLWSASLIAILALSNMALIPESIETTHQGGSADVSTILLMGVDRRPGEPIDQGVRPDALGVLHLDGQTGACRLLSIPRDTRAQVTGLGISKVNHAHAFAGVEVQQQTVADFLGIPIDRYGLIDMQGFALMIDTVGGIEIMEPEVFELGPYAYESSPQMLNGDEALYYARYRDGPDGDFGRIRRQQQVLSSFLGSTSDLDAKTVLREVVPMLQNHTRTDMSIDELVALAGNFRDTCTAETIGMDVLNGTTGLAYDEIYQQDLSMVFVDTIEIECKVAWLLGR